MGTFVQESAKRPISQSRKVSVSDAIEVVKPLKTAFDWATLEIRVTNDVVKKAKDFGIPLVQRELRQFLYNSQFGRRISDLAQRELLRDALRQFVGNDETLGKILFALLEAAFVARSSPVDAIRAVGANLSEQIDLIAENVAAGNEDVALWPVRLHSFMPLRAQTAELLREQWASMPQVVGLLQGSSTTQRLESWAKRRPKLLDHAPAELFCWLSDLADDLGLSSASLHFLDEALDRGPIPLGYWEARRLWMDPAAYKEGETTADHPLSRAWYLQQRGDGAGALAAIKGWEPISADEIATRGVLLAQAAYSSRNYDEALALAETLWSETGFPVAARLMAKTLMSRQIFTANAIYAEDTATALSVLLLSRDRMRAWGYNTCDQIVLATKAARLLHDPERALRLTQIEPEGEATSAESQDTRVRAAAAVLLADGGQLDEAREIVDDPKLNPEIGNYLRAKIALEAGDTDSAAMFFSNAIDQADDPEDKGQYTYDLALLGIVHPFAKEQQQLGNEGYLEHLTLIADAFGGRSGGEDRLRAAAHTSPTLSVILSNLYDARGESDAALASLTSAAARLNDSDLWLSVAKRQQQSGRPRDAIESLERALADAQPVWGGHVHVRGLLIEAHSRLGDWDAATRAAEHLVRLVPKDLSAAWMLAGCQRNAGELDAALSTWTTRIRRQLPDTQQDTRTWLALYQEYGEAVGSTEDLVSLAAKWAGDEEIRTAIVGLAILPGRSATWIPEEEENFASEESPPDADQAARSKLLEEYLQDFPEGAIRPFTVDLTNGADILGQISSALESFGERPDTSELDDQVFRGQLPVGMLTLAHGSTLTEAIISNASGVRFASTTALTGIDGELPPIDESVVVDTTALFALSVLPEDLRVSLTGALGNLSISASQYRDAIDGLQSIKRFGHAGPNLGKLVGPVANRGRSKQSFALDRSRADDLVSLMKSMSRGSKRNITQFDEIGGEVADYPWFGSIALAGKQSVLWCDDNGLAILASHLGVRTFSTPMLVATLELRKRISAATARQIRVRLIAERYVTYPFEAELYEEALSTGHEGPNAITAVIENLGGENGDAVLDFMASHAADMAPDSQQLEKWLSAFARWTTRVSADRQTVEHNMRLLVSRVVRSSWMVPQTFPYIDQGIADGLGEDCSVEPLVDAIQTLHDGVSEKYGPRAAANWVLELSAGLDPSRRVRYTRIALT
jgi:tetratricopeptide (TPR) repeat protein